MPRTFRFVLAQPDFGFSVGANVSSLVPDYGDVIDGGIDLGLESRFGFGVAAFADVAFTNTLFATAEASFVRRRYSFPPTRTTTTGGGALIEWSATSLDFVSLGVFGRALPFKQGPYVLLGSRLDLLVHSAPGRSASPYADGGGPVSEDGQSVFEGDFIDDEFPTFLSSVSLSGVVGLGVAVNRSGWPRLRTEVRYGRTLTNFFDVDTQLKGHVSGFDLSVGVLL